MTAPITEWAAFQRASGASPATVQLRADTISQVTRHAGKATPTDLARRDVIAYLARPLRPWSRVTYWRCLCAWDRWALEFGYTAESITRGIPAPKVPKAYARPLTDEDIFALLESQLSRRARAYITLGLYAALRVSEIARVRGEHVDQGAGWLLVVDGKGGVTLPIPAHAQVLELAATMPEQGYWFPHGVRPAEHVDPKAVSTTIKNAMAAAGIHGTAHRLRDSAATQMQRRSGDITLTQSLLRHSDVKSTRKYVGVSDTALKAAVGSLDFSRHAA